MRATVTSFQPDARASVVALFAALPREGVLGTTAFLITVLPQLPRLLPLFFCVLGEVVL
jgi:hypothetical protein